jgi:hypothetical protein
MAVGEGLWRGELPYRDLWDHKPPGIYLLASMGWPVLWSLTVVAIAGTGMVLTRLTGRFVALVAVVCLAMYPAALGGGQTETFAVLPAALAVLLGCRGQWGSAGVATAGSILISLQFAPLPIAMVLLGGRTRYAYGFAAPLLLAAGAMLLADLLPAAWDALVVYSGEYLGSSGSEDAKDAWHLLLIGLPLLPAVRIRNERIDLAMVLWLLLNLGALAIQGRILGHYASAYIVPLAILARHPSHRLRQLLTIAVACSLLLSVAASRAYPQRGPATEEIGAWIRDHTVGEDRILVWGVEANIYLTAARAPAGRYPYLMPLVTPGYTTQQIVDDWVTSLARMPPAVIVDSEAANSYWADGADFLRPPPPGAAGGRNLDLLGSFRSFVRREYVLATVIEERKVYVRR